MFFQFSPPRYLKLLILLPVPIGIGAFVYQYIFSPPEFPREYLEDHLWATDGELTAEEDKSIRNFTIHVEDDLLQDLKQKLNATRFANSLNGTNLKYGFNSERLKYVVTCWNSTYDWRKSEKELNKFDHHLTTIEQIDVHFIHIRPVRDARNVVPLLMIHGWPTGVYQFYKIASHLIAPEKNLVFELVIPSIPGYGFSQAPQRPGFTTQDAARIFGKLMDRLNYREFYVHGENWGWVIGQCLSVMYPDRVLGFHTTSFMPNLFHPSVYLKVALGYLLPDYVFHNSDADLNKVLSIILNIPSFIADVAFALIHETKADTLAAGLTDSPAGLAAYIFEWFSICTNKENSKESDESSKQCFELDELLTNVMIYWINGNMASAMRLYQSLPSLLWYFMRTPVPEQVYVGLTMSPHKLTPFNLPRTMAEDVFLNLIYYNDLYRAGNFSSLEQSELMANSIRRFVAKCIRKRDSSHY